MRVLLVHPPRRGRPESGVSVPPLGLLYLASSLEAAGHRVGLIDARVEALRGPRLLERARSFAPELIGLGGLTPVFEDSVSTARLLSSIGAPIVLGGPHATVRGARVLEEVPEASYVVRGEGERALPALVSALARAADPAEVPGVVTRGGEGPQPATIEDLDALPVPARHLLPARGYRYPLWRSSRIVTALTSRGCPFRCIFCEKAVHGDPYRARSAASVADELEGVLAAGPEPFVIFYDDLFTLRRERVLSICDEIVRRGLRFHWKAEARVEQVDRELLRAMKRAGLAMLAFGVDSGSDDGLKFLRKGFRVEHVRRAFALCREEGVATLAYLILGLPSQTPEAARESIRLAVEIRPTYAQFSTLSPFEGTPLHALAERQGWLRESVARSPLDTESRRVTAIGPAWDDRALKRLLREAYLRFYLRPRAILDLLGLGSGRGSLTRGMSAGWRVVQWAFQG